MNRGDLYSVQEFRGIKISTFVKTNTGAILTGIALFLSLIVTATAGLNVGIITFGSIFGLGIKLISPNVSHLRKVFLNNLAVKRIRKERQENAKKGRRVSPLSLCSR